MMKNLKLLGVLLVGILMPILVNAETCTENCMAQIGDTKYATINEAIATEGDLTIEVLMSGETDGIKVPKGKNVILDLNGNTLTFKENTLVGSNKTKTQNMQILAASFVIKDGTLIASNDAKMLIQNYSSLTLDNVTLDGRNAKASDDKYNFYALSLNQGSINIIGETNIYSNEIAFDAYYWPDMGYVDGAQVKVDTTGKIVGTIEVDASSKPEESKTILEIKNINHEGIIDVKDEKLNGNVLISNGTFTTDVSVYLKDKENTKAILEDGKYSIYQKFDIVGDLEPENGTIELDKYSAFYKDEVTIKVTPNEGYEIDSVRVIDKDNNVIEVKDNKFTMPASDAWVSVKFKEIKVEEDEPTEEIPSVSTTIDVPVVDKENTMGVSDADKTVDVLKETLSKNDEYKDLSVIVKIEVEDIKASKDVEKEFNKALEEDKKENSKIVSYFDISVVVKNTATNKVEGYLTELTDKIEFTVTLPKLDEVEEGYTRNYYVIKKHGDKVEVIDAKVSKDGKSITFATDEFSTYALAYEDVAKEASSPVTPAVPQTFDGIDEMLICGCLALISLVGISLYFKKYLKNN